MPRVEAFHGLHFNWHRLTLDRTVCPPYDVISPELGRRLRRFPYNTIHVELPRGSGSERYRRAREAWKRWDRDRALTREARPSFYVVEQRFSLGGKKYRRVGVLGALGLDEESLRDVVPHEKTLPKPKEDRLRLLRTLNLNTSPIFAVYSDARGRVRRCLERAMDGPPAAEGHAQGEIGLRVWIAGEPSWTEELTAALRGRKVLIADGHHRLEVAREYCRLKRQSGGSLLCYFCAEEDPGLVVLPTHRVAADAPAAVAAATRRCRLAYFKSRPALEKALARHPSPYAFGIVSAAVGRPVPGAIARQVPRVRSTTLRAVLAAPVGPVRGIRTGLGVEWLAKKILRGVDPQQIRYTHDSREAAAWARRSGGVALLVKPVQVADIRRAVDKAGLLPQKSTYFYPKIQAGIVFKEA